MIRDLVIENFRAFKRLEMRGLGRVNLLVGANESGKTSVLEAIHLLTTPGNIQAFWWIGGQRGELSDAPLGVGEVIEFSRLFYGWKIVDGATIKVSGQREKEALTLMVKAVSQPEGGQLQFQWEGSAQHGPTITLPLSSAGTAKIAADMLTWTERLFQTRSLFLTNASLSAWDAVSFFDSVVLTPGEQLLTEALQAIDARILRVAPKHEAHFDRIRRGGFHVLLNGDGGSVPIGNLGDGAWRMLSIALALAVSSGGVLLIDDIDTGLHFTVMDKMWQLVSAAAEKLNVQVFATTHSRDCVESLAVICHKDSPSEGRVSIQRIERQRGRSVAISEAEIVAVAKRGIEVR
jgi:energy-coupling factor transporter ATP-binding protein EcfA2